MEKSGAFLYANHTVREDPKTQMWRETHIKNSQKEEVKNMAEETKTTIETTETTESQDGGTTPTVEELMAQLAQANADRDRYKSANDKLSKSEAEMKRQLRAKQSEEERASAEQAEAQRIKDEELENLRSEYNRIKAVNAYKTVSDEKMVDNLIAAVSESNHSEIATIMEKYAAAKVKEAQAEWQKSRPRVNMGGEGGLTKEQFDAMSMAEKSKLYRENKAEYDRLNN